MSTNLKMKAPEGTSSAVIEGHEYQIPKNGVITVMSTTHLETLHRHGFTDVASDGLMDEINSTNDKARLIEIIEEHGGDADEDMKLSRLRRMAIESVEDQQEEPEEEEEQADEDEQTEEEEEEKPAPKRRRSKK